MSEVQNVKRADDPLTVNETDGLELPEGYASHTGNLVIRTPAATHDIRRSGDEPMGPFTRWVRPYHFDVETDDHRNGRLYPDKVSLKKYGEDAEVFAVDV